MDPYYCSYNLAREHRTTVTNALKPATIRCAPAKEAGVARSALTVADLVDMAA